MRTRENRITNRVKYFTTSSLSSLARTPICECGIYLLHTRKWGLFNSTMCAHSTVLTFREFGFCTPLFSLIIQLNLSFALLLSCAPSFPPFDPPFAAILAKMPFIECFVYVA